MIVNRWRSRIDLLYSTVFGTNGWDNPSGSGQEEPLEAALMALCRAEEIPPMHVTKSMRGHLPYLPMQTSVPMTVSYISNGSDRILGDGDTPLNPKCIRRCDSLLGRIRQFERHQNRFNGLP